MTGVIFICKNIPCSTNFIISTVFNHFVHGKHDLARIGHGFLWSPSFCISFSCYWPENILCFLELSHICGYEVFPSWLRIVELKEGPVYIQWNFDWWLFLSRDARMCNGRCLHSSMIGMLCTAFWGPSRAIQTIRCCSTSFFIFFDSGLNVLQAWFCRRSCWRSCRSGWFSIFWINSRTLVLCACFTTECGNPGIRKSMFTSFSIVCSRLKSSWLTTGRPDLSCASSTLRLLLSSDERVWFYSFQQRVAPICHDLGSELVGSIGNF